MLLAEQPSVHIMTPFGAKSLYCDSHIKYTYNLWTACWSPLLHHTRVDTTLQICSFAAYTRRGGSGLLQGRVPNTKDAAHASHLIYFAMAGEAISDTVPRAGAVSSARARVLAKPKWTTASVVLARKVKGFHGGASSTI